MSESSPSPRWAEFHPTGLLKALNRAVVDFVVIGGMAAVLHGSARVTHDLDITYSAEPENLRTLDEALSSLKALRWSDAEPVAFDDLSGESLLTLDTRHGPLSLEASPRGAPPYDELRRESTPMALAGGQVLVASIDHLIAMKAAMGTLKDLADIDELLAISRLTRS